jgi:predicted metal-binding membrane protein
MTPAPSTLEAVLRRDRRITTTGLVQLAAHAWWWLLAGAGLGMSAWEMTQATLFPARTGHAMGGMAMPTPAPRPWRLTEWLLVPTMWWVMMVAMMTPSAAPTILLYARVHRHNAARTQDDRLAPTWAFAAGYLFAWLTFSLVAAGLQWGLQRSTLISAETMGSQSRWLSAAVLLAAGLYQFSPIQNLCLSHCRSPGAFLARHWRPGMAGALRLGMLHGTYCVGCCWLLMGLLFVGGVMNLLWIALLSALVLAEKALAGGRWIARASGALMLAWGAATLLI